MDVLTVAVSAAISAMTTLAIMICIYSKWILPAIEQITAQVPVQVKEFVTPYIDGKMGDIQSMISGSIEDVKLTLRQSSASFHKTVKNAEKYLSAYDIDLSTDEGVEDAKSKLEGKYGLDLAYPILQQLITSITAPKKAEIKPTIDDGWGV